MESMKKKSIFQLILTALILLAAASCASEVKPDWIKQAGLYADPAGTQPTDAYGWRDIFYLVVELNGAPPDTVVQASWIAVDTTRLRPDTVLKIEEKEAQSSLLVFELENAGNFWPEGEYQVNIYLDQTLSREIKFQVHFTDVY
jgi:hypothetical protein